MRSLLRKLGLAFLLLSATNLFGQQNIHIPINVRATYLFTYNDPQAVAATPISLASLGIKSGDTITLTAAGDFGPCTPSCGEFFVPLAGLFSSDGTVAGAIAVPGAPAIVTPPTLFGTCGFECGGFPTDIPQDFFIPQASFTTVVVPAGANYLFIIVSDSFYGDNNNHNLTATINATWTQGDVFAAVGNGEYEVFHNIGTAIAPNYVLVEMLRDAAGNDFTAGCAFDSTGNLFTTNFSNTEVSEFAAASPHNLVSPPTPINSSGDGGSADTESIAIASNGNLYVGNADSIVDGTPTEGGGKILEISPAGATLAVFDDIPDQRGSDWIDLSSDQKTVFYTSEGTLVKRFDTSINTQLPDFASISDANGKAFAIRLLPPFNGSGGLLVADRDDIKRLDGSGNVVQTYPNPESGAASGETSWFSLNLDPNGTSFWAGDGISGDLYRFNIATGVVEVGPISTVPFLINETNAQELAGICVNGEGSAALVTSFTTPPQTVTAGGSNPFPDPGGSGATETFSFPNGTTFGNATGTGLCTGTPSMAISFQYWNPTLFDTSRLPGVPQNPNWSGGTTPLPRGAFCSVIDNTNGNCLVTEALCYCGATQLAVCNTTAPLGKLIGVATQYQVATQPQTPLLAIADDGQNNWANITTSYSASDPIIGGGTIKLNTDLFIGDVGTQFIGFTSPVVDPCPNATIPPFTCSHVVVNMVNAGSSVPVKWTLLDKNGVGISGLKLAPSGTVTVTANPSTVCSKGGTIDTSTTTTTSGKSGLQYFGGGVYQLNWSTSGLVGGKCIDLAINPGDGSEHHAYFLTK